ncbi:MAG: ankyrin repeat domain-containing protein [Nannocystis sp.]|nr:ankyrin repeat domain-containing protein [Nannocystis sp.]MBA3550247.1 ankyrin repeat domain-containing protein [Nannocystis sp.]
MSNEADEDPADEPLVVAAAEEDLDEVRRLLDAGGDPNAWGQGDETALIAAIRSGAADIVALLLERGADPDVNARSSDESPLMVAIMDGHYDPAIVHLLVDRVADIDEAVPEIGLTVLQLALEHADLELIHHALARGARLTDAGLEAAAETGRIEVIERAFAAPGGGGERPWRDVLGPERSAELQQRGLLAATHRGHEDTVAVLLADPRLILPQYGLQDVWRAALASGRSAVIDIVEPKLDRGYLPENLLRDAAAFGRRGLSEALLASKVPLPPDALHGAARRADVAWIERLLVLGADKDARDTGGRTPLISAASAGREVIVEALLAVGADVHARDQVGATAIHHAALAGARPTIERLIAAGGDPRVNDRQGRSTAAWARYRPDYLAGDRRLVRPEQEAIAAWLVGLGAADEDWSVNVPPVTTWERVQLVLFVVLLVLMGLALYIYWWAGRQLQ